MPTRSNRLERMTNLVLALLHANRPLSLREIGQLVAGYPKGAGALRQAFERDKRTLRDLGIPLSVERLDGEEQVGYRIVPEEYYLPELGLSDEERAAIVLALVAVRLEGGAALSVAEKLGSATSATAPVAVLPALPALAALQQAVRERAPVSFAYRGRARRVEGYGLVFRAGSWYFVGRDAEADADADDGGGLRSFRVDRFEGVPAVGGADAYVVPESFDIASTLRLAPFSATAGEGAGPEEAELVVDVREAGAVRATVGEGAVRSQASDGSLRLCFAVADEEAFVHWVLGLGDSVEVIGPPRLRRAVVEALAEAARR